MKTVPLFTKRAPPDKHWSFLQKCQKYCATSKCGRLPYFAKVCTIPKNIFGQNMTLFLTVTRVYTTTHFCSLRCLVDGKQLKNRPKMDEKWYLSPPQEILPIKIDPFCKNIKSKGQHQPMYEFITLWKWCKPPENIFGQNRAIFNHGGQVLYIPCFCSLLLLADGKQLKTRLKMNEKWVIFSPGEPPGKKWTFL